MQERLIIKEVFLKYVNALESDNMNALTTILSDKVILESTNYGNAVGKAKVIQKLKWQGINTNYARYKIFDFVAFTEGNRGCQSAVVTALVGLNEDDYFHYFNFSGYYLNDYIKENNEWKISHIRFNLDMEDGNTVFVKDWWKLIDYRYFEGSINYPIVSELNNPWINIQNPDCLGTEEEQVLDSYYRYSWGIDHADFDLFQTCLDDNVTLFGSKEPLTKEDVIRYMKYKRYKEATMEHIWKIDSIDINADIAILKTKRYEPHRMGTTKFNKQNMNYDFYTGNFEYIFVKKDGKNYRDGGWKMKSNNAKELKVSSEDTYDTNKFF